MPFTNILQNADILDFSGKVKSPPLFTLWDSVPEKGLTK